MLVDDLDPLHPVVQMKMLAAGVPPYVEPEREEWGDAAEAAADEAMRQYFAARQVRPPEFVGHPEDAGLSGIADAVALALEAQSA